MLLYSDSYTTGYRTLPLPAGVYLWIFLARFLVLFLVQDACCDTNAGDGHFKRRVSSKQRPTLIIIYMRMSKKFIPLKYHKILCRKSFVDGTRDTLYALIISRYIYNIILCQSKIVIINLWLGAKRINVKFGLIKFEIIWLMLIVLFDYEFMIYLC